MVVYNLKGIQVVPGAKDFVDIVLSKTQRKTPTIVHKGYAISRIRSFYMRKAKFVAQECHDRITQILNDFPILDEIHPFYADLMNVLYDRDHYKLALGQLNTARSLIDNLGKDYARLLKYGDSLYRCKQLKRAALGRMCTIMRKQGPNLAYLEQVRQHLARLPSIDPNARTIIICGYPNVGKSSFMNKVTRANVDVQPYAFTTKSLFVGHTDYRYLRWQVIDTPGILDHPLEERNTIEMQSITALAHLRAAILFVIDISEECGFSIKQQVALFDSIKPLFANKPLVVAFNKIDVCTLDKVPQESRELLESITKDSNVSVVQMSTFTEIGITQVKESACDRLLEQRVELKMMSKHISGNMNRLHLAMPIPRDQKERPAFIPASVAAKRQFKADANAENVESEFTTKMEVDVEGGFVTLSDGSRLYRDEARPVATITIHSSADKKHLDPDFDPTIFGPDWRKEYLLADDDWKFDNVPEIMDGMNVADYIDPDILARLDELEREEEERELEYENFMKEEAVGLLSVEEQETLGEIRTGRDLLLQKHRLNKGTMMNRPVVPRKFEARSTGDLKDHLSNLGIDAAGALKRARSRSASRSDSQPRGRAKTNGTMMDSYSHHNSSRSPAPKKLRVASKSRERSASSLGFRSDAQKEFAEKKNRLSQVKRNQSAKKGEGDRVILNMMPKHLFSGKRGNGKTDRR